MGLLVETFSGTNVCATNEGARRTGRDFNTLAFSKLVLETFFSTRTIAMSFTNAQATPARLVASLHTFDIAPAYQMLDDTFVRARPASY